MSINVAMIGVGAISGIYLENLTNTFTDVHLMGVCDLVRERAATAQEKYGVPKLYERMEDAFADPEIDVILNLTRPYEHLAVTRGALMAGKHVYSEKPLGADFAEGKELFALAKEKGLHICGAPDTFLGAGIQTCRRLIDDGVIGDVIGSAAFMICRGHETWHPDPAFYYQWGGGPMMDMGPYYVTALVNLMGGVKAVSGVVKKSFDERIITSKPFSGTRVKVEVPTHVTGTLHFDSGAVGTIITTFDVYYDSQARFEIYGTKGTLYVPDPNLFGGPVRLLLPQEGKVVEMPLMYDYKTDSRGLGLMEMCDALTKKRTPRNDSQQLTHVLEVLTSFEKSSAQGKTLELETKYERRPAFGNHPIHGLMD